MFRIFSVLFLLICSCIVFSAAAESEQPEKKNFYAAEISDSLFERIKGKSFKENCTVPRSELRYIHILHKDLNGRTKSGEIICSRLIADDLLDIFKKLYEAGYPVESVRLVDDFNADDEVSMRVNNSSCFNFRFMTDKKKLSNHSLGLAVDINPLYNPYVKTVNGKTLVCPSTAVSFTDRTKIFPYKIEENDLCCRLFAEHGFTWGGSWTSLKDYQHFEKNFD